MAKCINLLDRFGDRFRVQPEPTTSTNQRQSRGGDPWLFTIPCRHGHIYPHGGSYLGASTDHRGPIANQLAALPFVRIVQDGDDGINVVFRVDDFDQVAEVMRPRRRRKLPPDHSANLTRAGVAALARHRNSSDARSERRRDPIGPVDSQTV